MKRIYTYAYRQGPNIACRFRDKNGESHAGTVRNFNPHVFMPDSEGTHTDHRGEVSLRDYPLPADLGEASAKLREMGNDVYGTKNFHHQYIQKFFHDHQEYSRLKDLIHRAIIDIEVYSPNEFPDPEKAKHPINAITLYSSKTDTYHVFHLYDHDWKSKSRLNEYEPGVLDKVVAYACEDEKSLLEHFLRVWSADYPDIVSGWNSDTFDFPYLFNRLIRVFNKKKANELSPFNKVRRKTVKGRFGKEESQIDIVGVEIRDYLNLYLKYTFKKRESYKLDYIAYVELDERKVEYDQDGLHSLADEDPNKFVDYNWKDVWLVKRLDDKLGLMNLIIDLAYMTGINFEETDSPIKLWDNMITNYLADRDMHLPVNGLGNPKREFEGAYVYDDIKIGLHRWIVSFDLTSLYPSIIRQWNMGPDTIEYSHLEEQNIVQDIVDGKVSVDDGYCIAGNGTVYRTDRTSFLNALMTSGFEERKAAKKKMLEAKQNNDEEAANLWHTRQLALKVFLNSGYGAFGNQYFRAFDVRIAEAITLSGQLSSKWLFRDLIDYLNKICGSEKDRIVAGDTDSVYITLEDLVDRFMPNETDENKIVEFLDAAAEKIIKDCIEPSYRRMQEATGCREQLMNMDREVIGSDAFWRAKKNYAIRILDDEGKRLEEPKYKIMGLEPAKSTYREDDRKKMEEAIHIILDRARGATNDDLLKLIDDYRDEYMDKPLHEVGKAIRVSKIDKWIDGEGVKSGTPGHTKAAINYNNQIRKHGLTNRFPLIQEADNIFQIELKKPNPTPYETIAHLGVLPKELGLEKYVDYATMFNKYFFAAVESYADAVGWKAEDFADLTAFMG